MCIHLPVSRWLNLLDLKKKIVCDTFINIGWIFFYCCAVHVAIIIV